MAKVQKQCIHRSGAPHAAAEMTRWTIMVQIGIQIQQVEGIKIQTDKLSYISMRTVFTKLIYNKNWFTVHL